MLRQAIKLNLLTAGRVINTAAIALGLVGMVYVLSIGPVYWVECRTGYINGATELLYGPLDRLPESLERVVDAYVAFWVPPHGCPVVPLPTPKEH